MNKVYLTGFSLHTALGRGVDANLQALARGPVSPRSVSVELAADARDVPYYLLSDMPLRDLEARFDAVLVKVVADSLQSANLSVADRRSMAFFMGSSCGEMPVAEADYRRALQASRAALPLLNANSQGNLANRLREHFQLRGPDFSFYTACTASANALWYAAQMIRSGRLRHALVLGVELFNAVTALGFGGLQLLTHEVMRPFDRRRSGLVPGEACAAVVLSAQRPAGSAWSFVAGANLCDTHSISATNPDGSRVAEVMRQALAAGGLSTSDIAALKVHGTASLLNDEAEAAGMRQLFAQLPPLCALKPYLGHTFGACGVAELLLFCSSVARGVLPATPDICAQRSDLDVVLTQQPQVQPPGHFMLNYFGFGGSNTSLIVANCDD